MDYPKSVPSVGLVNGRFVDEDPLAGTPGSLIPAAWGNGVTQEILGVVKAAGMTPDEANSNQLLGALRSPALFMTAAQFDASRSAATCEFVQQALGSHANARSIAGPVQLTAADVGCAIGLGGTAAYTVTLPDAATVPVGASISLHCRNTVPVTVASKTGAQISPQGAYLGSITINNGESATFVREAGIWVVHGTAALKYSASYASQFSTAGYQRFPSGFILQWVTGGSDANGVMTVSLPITFPNAVLGGLANEGYPPGWGGSNVTVWAFDHASSTTTTAVARVRNVMASSVKADPGISGRILVWGR
ncbi:phage tail protein [Pseudomonas sp. NPDC089534]|uniref:gp53-like domain-containing protein n=1 Tax=Pseudomonas sp. NPDC089534 TaxID=3364468 RepID=UPI0037F1CD52